MQEVAENFESTMGVKPAVYLRPKKTPNYKTLKEIWKSGGKDQDKVDQAIDLLKEYVSSKGPGFIADFEDKQYTKEIMEALVQFKTAKPNSVQELLNYFSEKLQNPKNPQDYLIERLAFIARKTKSEFNLAPEPKTEIKLSGTTKSLQFNPVPIAS